MEIITSSYPVDLHNNIFTSNADENFEFVMKDDYEEIVSEVKCCDLQSGLDKYNINSSSDNVRKLINSKDINRLLGHVNSSGDKNTYNPAYKEDKFGKYSEMSLDNNSIEGFLYSKTDTHIEMALPDNSIFIINNLVYYIIERIKINKGQYIPIRIISSDKVTAKLYNKGVEFFRPILKETNV